MSYIYSVYLSPSTQEKNIGANNYGSEEYRMNQVADVTEEILKQHGIKVYRNKPTMSLGEVVRDSNIKNVDIHFAIHSNAYNKKSRGCEIFCYKKGGEGEKLSKAVYSKIEALTPSKDRGIKEGYNFYGTGKHMYEVAYTKVPASLIEIAFHDNPSDAIWIIKNIIPIGILIAQGIIEYFGIKYIQTDSNDKFPLTKKAEEILKETSKYSDTWINFFRENEFINLSGLIENLYNNYEKDYIKKLILELENKIELNKAILNQITDKIEIAIKNNKEMEDKISKYK